jgi:hypothetical protein
VSDGDGDYEGVIESEGEGVSYGVIIGSGV